jgi:hypothetical protein
MKHPGHMYGDFIPAISERGMTLQEGGQMHRFWSSHEEKRICVRLSMGGQPWPSSRSINDNMASSRERKGREGEGEQGGATRGGC